MWAYCFYFSFCVSHFEGVFTALSPVQWIPWVRPEKRFFNSWAPTYHNNHAASSAFSDPPPYSHAWTLIRFASHQMRNWLAFLLLRSVERSLGSLWGCNVLNLKFSWEKADHFIHSSLFIISPSQFFCRYSLGKYFGTYWSSFISPIDCSPFSGTRDDELVIFEPKNSKLKRSLFQNCYGFARKNLSFWSSRFYSQWFIA